MESAILKAQQTKKQEVELQQQEQAGKAEKRREGVELSPEQENFLLNEFSLLIVGKPGSGKSYLAKELLTSTKYYKGKFDKIIVISPSVQKLGIPVSKADSSQDYNIDWIMLQITKINQSQIKKFENVLKSKTVKRIVPFLPQSIIEASLGREMKQGARLSLPTEYLSFNREQRFFTMEMLSIMQHGYTNIGPGSSSSPYVTNSNSSSLIPSKAKKLNSKLTAATPAVVHPYGKYENVDDIEEQLVAKMPIQDVNKTRFNLVIVLDDVVSSIKAEENNRWQSQLFLNRRHLIANGCISIISISQKFTMFPSRLRSNQSWLILFRLNPKDMQNVYDDVVTMPLRKWEAVVDEVFHTDNELLQDRKKKTHHHLDIFVEYDMYFKDFKRIEVK